VFRIRLRRGARAEPLEAGSNDGENQRELSQYCRHVPVPTLRALLGRAYHIRSVIGAKKRKPCRFHGIAKRAQGGAIRISALRSNGRLTISVYNDGPKLRENWDKSSPGIGLSNVRTRLQRIQLHRHILALTRVELHPAPAHQAAWEAPRRLWAARHKPVRFLFPVGRPHSSR